MADYYPLIARAIAGLDPNAPGESRRALYERARTALIAQLRSVQPPLSESEITRERLSLEEAVRKVEIGSRPARPRGQPRRRRGRPWPRGFPPRQCPAAGSRRSALPVPLGAPPPGGPPRQRPPSPPPGREGRPPLGQDEQRPQRNLRPDALPSGGPRPQAPQIPMQDPDLPPPPPRGAGPRRGPTNGGPPQPPGMTGFRDIAADADDLGRAAAQANRAARKTYANVPSPSPEFDRLEPNMENRGADPDAPYSYDRIAGGGRPLRAAAATAGVARAHAAAAGPRPRAQAGARPRRRRVSVQERDRGRHRADPGRRRHPVGQVGGDGRQRPVQVHHRGGGAKGSGRAAVAAEDSRSRRPASR